MRLRKKLALKVLLLSTRALKALNTWNNTKVVKAMVCACVFDPVCSPHHSTLRVPSIMTVP